MMTRFALWGTALSLSLCTLVPAANAAERTLSRQFPMQSSRPYVPEVPAIRPREPASELPVPAQNTPAAQETNLLSETAQPVPESVASAPAPANAEEQAPVDFAADSLEYDESGQIVTARGNVELLQDGNRLTADEVRYNLQTDRAFASGNVVLTDNETGDVYTAESFEISNDMKDGLVNELYAVLTDGSRFWAEEGERRGGTKLIMKNAAYTPCDPCKDDPTAAPVWQIVAGEVEHDKEDARVTYHHARFEVYGVPVAYTPYFSHPDGTVKQKSGFLSPSAGLDSELGANYEQQYYWAIAEDKDATVGVRVFSDEKPLVSGEYRQRFDNAAMTIAGGITQSDRFDSVGGQERIIRDEVRGHFFGEGRYDINDKWRAGTTLAVVSDRQYARQYDITNEDILENEVYLERLEGRNYSVVRAMAFQDLRVSDRKQEQPQILPEINASFVGDPNGVLGGRWMVNGSALGLERDGNGQDMARGTLDVNWQRRDVLPFGLVSTLDLSGRGDAYNVRDRNIATPGSGRAKETNTVRGFAQAHWQTGLPLVKHFSESGTQMVIEPLVALTAGTNVDVNNDIPDEDSQDIVLDALKLFEPNRFTGYDRIDDESRATYGIRTGLYGNNGWSGEVFFGQSRNFNDKDNPFPEGSGLSEQQSDYVGSVDVSAGQWVNINYRLQLDDTKLHSQRHEFAGWTDMGFAAFSGRYLYTAPLVGTDLNEAREQGYAATRIRLSDSWHVLGGATYDFGENEGLRQASYGIEYLGQCVTISAIGQRELTNDTSGDAGTEFMVRLGLKNLGEVETSVLSVGGSDE